MNPITPTATAAEINRLHGLATTKAGEAIDHAKEAGRLLLQVKATMPHGQWLPWLAANIAVSPRQAQRYIQVAQGRPLPIRAPERVESDSKCDPAVSHLPNTHRLPVKPGFAALPDRVMTATHEGRHLVIEQSTTPGFFFVSCLALVGDDDATHDYTTDPVGGDDVVQPLQAWRVPDPGALEWHSIPMERPAKAALVLADEVPA